MAMAKYVQTLVENGADVNLKNHGQGLTPICIAIGNGRTEIFSYLVKKADLNVVDNKGFSPVSMAVQNGREDYLRELISHGSALSSDRSALRSAINAGSVKFLEILLQNGADPNLRGNIDDGLPLGRAIHYYSGSSGEDRLKYKEMAILLVENGAEISKRTKNGEATPEEFASRVDPELLVEIKAARERYFQKTPDDSVRKKTSQRVMQPKLGKEF